MKYILTYNKSEILCIVIYAQWTAKNEMIKTMMKKCIHVKYLFMTWFLYEHMGLKSTFSDQQSLLTSALESQSGDKKKEFLGNI